MRDRICLLGLGCFVLALSAGCGDESIRSQPVAGVVTLDGQPVEGATVTFSPLEQGRQDASFGRTDAEGRYRLRTVRGKAEDGTTPGEYAVVITKTELVETGKMLPTPIGTLVPQTKPKENVPLKYTDPTTSGFKATVVKGENTFDFHMKSKE
jgi:hypothetical protein